MSKNTLRKTGYSFGEVGLGCWQFGGDHSTIDAGRVNEILDTSLNYRVNFFDTVVELVGKVRGIMPKDMKLAQAAQRWILDTPDVSTIITGASSADQVLSNVSVSEIPHCRQRCMHY